MAEALTIAEAVTGIAAPTLARAARLELLDSALHAPQAGFGEVEFYPEFAQKAAVLVVRIARNHPLPDGNKRLAWQALTMFCALNGHHLEVPATHPCPHDILRFRRFREGKQDSRTVHGIQIDASLTKPQAPKLHPEVGRKRLLRGEAVSAEHHRGDLFSTGQVQNKGLGQEIQGQRLPLGANGLQHIPTVSLTAREQGAVQQGRVERRRRRVIQGSLEHQGRSAAGQ